MSSLSLTQTLVRLVVERDWFFESCDDDVLDPDDAIKQLEWSGHVLNGLSPADLQEFLAILGELTAEETDPDLRAFMGAYCEGMGLVLPED